MAQQYLHSLFALAHTEVGSRPFNNQGRTLRLAVESNVHTTSLQIRFSNRCGTAPLPIGAASLSLCDEHGNLCANTLVPLTVEGRLAFELAPGEDLYSDSIPFRLSPGQHFALNLYYPTAERVSSGNWLGNSALRSRPGNFSADLELPGPGLLSRFARTVVVTDMTVSITSVCEIIAGCEKPNRLLACFGDSITQQSNWTAPLAKLLYHEYPGEITLCNLGISGNRLLSDSPPALGGLNGQAGIHRFEKDILSLHGLTHAILAIGTNDIGLPGAHGLPDSDLITLEEYVQGMEQLAGKLHQRGVKAYAATLTPRAMVPPYNEIREMLRLEMNHWIRNAACFDAVLDFDEVLRRTDGHHGMKEHCALPDGLHPSPYGGLWLAKSIDLSLFGSESASSNQPAQKGVPG